MSQSGIYLIRNLIDGKVYVGQASDIDRRRKQHFKDLRGGYHRNLRMQRAFERDGEKNFEFSVIEYCDCSSLTDREQYWLDFYNTSYRYNICPAANSTLGVKRSDEIREKLSALKKGKSTPWLFSKESREKARKTQKENWHSHKSRHTPEANSRRAAALRAKWSVTPKKKPSAEARQKMSLAARNRKKVTTNLIEISNEI